MRTALLPALALFLFIVPVQAQQVSTLSRGDIHITVRVHGTVSIADTVTLKSTIPGRIEAVYANSTGTWSQAGAELGTVASGHLAALLDSPTTTDRAVILNHWQKDFPLIPVSCPQNCYLLDVLVSPKDWIDPGTPLFKAALNLRLAGFVAPGDAHWIKDGQWLEFWASNLPKQKLRMQVENFILDHPGDPENSGGTFAMDMTPDEYLPPKTRWEGIIIPVDHPNALRAPTASLIEYNGSIFLPLHVSTGITTTEWTEITAGASEGRTYLIMNPSRLGKAALHHVRIPARAKAAPSQPESSAAADGSGAPDYGGDIYTQ
ncbi:MAG: efflux RND transporter periplasmic adaptor subunit [Elusimicrobiota bacterium]